VPAIKVLSDDLFMSMLAKLNGNLVAFAFTMPDTDTRFWAWANEAIEKRTISNKKSLSFIRWL
jgi:hypothetical protein